jgi:hypothetical protein
MRATTKEEWDRLPAVLKKLSELKPVASPGEGEDTWKRLPDLFEGTTRSGSVWSDGIVWVISSIVEEDGQKHWRLTMSRVLGLKKEKRPSMTDTRRVLRSFGMKKAIERENKDPAIRVFSRLVDDALQKAEIEVLKVSEHWKLDDGPCKVCELRARSGQACPFHPPAVASAAPEATP